MFRFHVELWGGKWDLGEVDKFQSNITGSQSSQSDAMSTSHNIKVLRFQVQLWGWNWKKQTKGIDCNRIKEVHFNDIQSPSLVVI